MQQFNTPLKQFLKLLFIAILIKMAFGPKQASAQPGSLDLTFNSLDNGTNVIEGANADVKTIALQADGKIIIGGTFTTFSGTSVRRIARLNTDGSVDASFNAGGAGFDSTVNKIIVQADGKIIVGGYFSNFNGAAATYLVRLNTDGSKDAGFNIGTGPNGTINTLSLDAAGKIIVAGKFTSYNGSVSNNIVRLNTNGTKDAVFTGSVGNSINDLAIQTDGRILVGINNDGNGLVTNFFVRLTTLGVVDPTFNVGQAGANNSVKAIKIQADGKILVGGDFSGFNDLSSNFTRLNADGSLDAAFENLPNGGLEGGINTITLQADGKILAGYGEYTVSYGGITEGAKLVRLNTDGTSDASFRYDFYTELNENVFTVLVQPNGKILVGETFVTKWGGSISRYAIHDAGNVTPGMRDFKINRYNADGSRDQAFGNSASETGPNRIVKAIATQVDGKVLVGGSFFSYNGVIANYLIRLNVDGSKDAGFNAGGIGFDKRVNAIAIQADGKIIVAGVFTKYNAIPVNSLIRLNADGSRDASFTSAAIYPGGEYSSLAIQPDGKILIGGLGTIFRVNTDGSVDTGYNTGLVSNLGVFFPSVNAIALQADGKIIGGGYFSKFAGSAAYIYKQHLGRLNSDGSADVNFATYNIDENMQPFSGANAPVSSVAIQPDGKILFSGDFTSYTANSIISPANHIGRLLPNGFIDTGFNPGGAGANGAINSILYQPNGRILIAGDFTSYNGVNVNRIARLNADGTLDVGFNAGGTGANAVIYAMAFEVSKSKLLIAGSFTSYNGVAKNRIVRLISCAGSSSSTTDLAICASELPYTWNGNSYNAAGTYTVTLTALGGCDSLATLNLSVGASAITGPVRACPYIQPAAAAAVYSITAPAGSTITWSVSKPLTMLILSGQGTNQVSVQYTNDFVSGTVNAKVVKVSCNLTISKSLSIGRTVPSTPAGIIAGTTNICPSIPAGTPVSFTISKVATATSYNWTAQAGSTTIYHPNGAGANDTTVLIIFAPNYTSSVVTVQAVNDCGTSNTRSLNVKLTVPAIPGAITGPSNVCEAMFPLVATPAHYAVTAVPDVTYVWSMTLQSPTPNWVINYTETGNTLDPIFREDFTTGVLSVQARNGCGLSPARTLNLRKLAVSTPGAITAANTSACPNRTYTYSIATTPANSTSIVWTVPTGGTIVSGQGTTSISVSYTTGVISGYVGVQAFNNCSSSSLRKITVSLTACPPGIPFARNGNETTNDVGKQALDMEIKVFPNPSVNDFKLQVITTVTEKATVRIFDIQGRPVKELTSVPNEITSFGNGLLPGTYFVEVRQGEKVKRTKIIKL